MSRDHDWRDDYRLALIAFRMCNVDLERRLRGDVTHQQQLAQLVRRIIASGYDADDCVRTDAAVAFRREVHALANALARMLPL